MRATFEIADVVGKGANVFRVAIVVLQGDTDLGLLDAAFDTDHVGREGRFGAVEMLDELDDAVGVLEVVRLAGALVRDENPRPRCEEGQLLQPLVEHVVAEARVGENLRVGLEGDLGSRAFALAELLETAHHRAAGKVHRPDVAFAADFGLEPFGKRVDGRDADAVQTAGARLVAAAAVELAAGVNLGEHDLEGRAIVHVGHGADGDAAAIVGGGDAAVGIDLDHDHRGEAVDRFIDAVVNDFVDEVMQTAGRGIPDVHGGPLADPFDPLEHADIAGIVGGVVVGLPQLTRVFFGLGRRVVLFRIGAQNVSSSKAGVKPLRLSPACTGREMRGTRIPAVFEFCWVSVTRGFLGSRI